MEDLKGKFLVFEQGVAVSPAFASQGEAENWLFENPGEGREIEMAGDLVKSEPVSAYQGQPQEQQGGDNLVKHFPENPADANLCDSCQ